MSIALRITKLIERLEISRYQLAKSSGVPYTTLIKVLDGTTKKPQIDTLQAIAAALNVSIEDITQPWASEIIDGLLESYKITYGDLAKGAKVSEEYLKNLDEVVPGHEDYEAMDRVARFLKISNLPIKAALARQEPPAYDVPALSAEEVFGEFDQSGTLDVNNEDDDWTDEERKIIEKFKQFVKWQRQQ